MSKNISCEIPFEIENQQFFLSFNFSQLISNVQHSIGDKNMINILDKDKLTLFSFRIGGFPGFCYLAIVHSLSIYRDFYTNKKLLTLEIFKIIYKIMKQENFLLYKRTGFVVTDNFSGTITKHLDFTDFESLLEKPINPLGTNPNSDNEVFISCYKFPEYE